MLLIVGLRLVINIDQDSYVPDIGDSAGIRVVIHPQRRMPFPEDEGLTVSPGHHTSIAVRQVNEFISLTGGGQIPEMAMSQ